MASGDSSSSSMNTNDIIVTTTTNTEEDASSLLLRELSFWEIGAARNQPQQQQQCSNVEPNYTDNNNSKATTTTTTTIRTFDAEEAAAANWKTASDPATGKIYYYDVVTRKTQWEKPREIRMLEKKRKEDKRNRDVVFFRSMEANIKASLARGERVPGVPAKGLDATTTTTAASGCPAEIANKPEPTNASKKPASIRVRTISGMNEHWLAELSPARTAVTVSSSAAAVVTPTATVPSTAAAAAAGSTSSTPIKKPPLLPPRHPAAVVSHDDEEEEEDAYTSSPSTPGHERASTSSGSSSDGEDDDLLRGVDFVVERHKRRNTYDGGCQTAAQTSTMDHPDIPATIKMVCGVIRAHILQSSYRDDKNNRQLQQQQPTRSMILPTVNVAIFSDKTTELPSVQQVQDFYWDFYRRSQMEFDAIILSLIYVERLIKETEGVLMPSPDNWQSILFSCMVLASKVWDDLSMWNIDFSNVSGNVNFNLQRINELERAILKCLNYAVVIPASEYAKYYYLLRNMMIRGGMLEDGVAADPCADRLQDRTRRYQAKQLNQNTNNSNDPQTGGVPQRRAHSVDWTEPVLKEALCMEQLVAGH